MVYWNRFISYIYRYHEDRKCENVGFAKVAKAGRIGKISVKVSYLMIAFFVKFCYIFFVF